MIKIIHYFNFIFVSMVILCSNVFSEENWQLYDDFSSGTIDQNKWYIDDSSAIITVENGQVTFAHQPSHANDSSWLLIADSPETIVGVRATVTAGPCSSDVQGRIGSEFGTIGSDTAFSQIRIRADQQTISAGVIISGPAPAYEYKYDYFWGNFQNPINVVGVPYTLSALVSNVNAKYSVDGQGELEFTFTSNLGPAAEGQKFVGIGTRSASGLGECNVVFNDVYILRSEPATAKLLTQTQVSQLYVSIFGRASEGEGNAYWRSEQDDMTIAADTMLNTEPAKAYFGATLNDNQAFIEFIYKNTLGKTYAEDPAGVNYWVGELAAGKSKGQVVATLINAAIDPQYAGLPAQDQFLNKITVSNYTADTITTVSDVNDLSAFVAFISGVTDDAATVVAAKAAIATF